MQLKKIKNHDIAFNLFEAIEKQEPAILICRNENKYISYVHRPEELEGLLITLCTKLDESPARLDALVRSAKVLNTSIKRINDQIEYLKKNQ